MKRLMAALVAATMLVGCGQETDTTQPSTNVSRQPSGYVIQECPTGYTPYFSGGFIGNPDWDIILYMAAPRRQTDICVNRYMYVVDCLNQVTHDNHKGAYMVCE
jgi:hypothetical protein